ncbi:hypothetical protein CHGG_08979 [Chaetomium globosum CBS 148.51]|uniref:Methyltransferase fungal type helix-turn-helix domain-containing protein n=1 Tax=Chaetomium globosum (strain ATCC 6205 / CBS 148.51 / DSM 1962 / NBRC 6347 / NRRL 1970) TaxID=306901 RepID=Q2GSS5_CHAGB|nr:uncharacterized protein CHGG_08979 [Chaetomium globosum CBS 148.51]EAQ84965.1 hypothetical protein CHGG_08979 [Chaetomium globosum CBS 148.51]
MIHSTTLTPRVLSAVALGVLGRVQSEFVGIHKLLERFGDEAGTSNFWTHVYHTQKRLVLAFINESFARLGYPLSAMSPGTPLPYPHAVQTKHHRVLRGAIFDILKDGGVADHQGGDRYVRTATPIDTTPAESIYQQLIRDYPLHANTHRLLHVTGSQFAECLTGAADPIRLLFGKSKALLQDFYTNAPMSVAASKLLVTLPRGVFSQIAREQNRSVEILEVGAGLGGTTQFVLDMLVEAGIPFKYVFTDISASFFGAAKTRYKDLPAGCIEYMVLDIEKAPPQHLQNNLAVSCSNSRRLLRAGGFFALVKFTTRLYCLDLVFGRLDGWWLFEDDRKHCTVNEAVWKAKLESSAFPTFCGCRGKGARGRILS